MRCRSRETAKKYHSDLSQDEQSMLAAVRAPTQARVKLACSGCGGSWHKAGRQQCPAYNHTAIRWDTLQEYAKVDLHSSQRGRTLQGQMQFTWTLTIQSNYFLYRSR